MNYLSPPRRLSQQREDVKAGRFDSYKDAVLCNLIDGKDCNIVMKRCPDNSCNGNF